ncbi:MAG: rbsK [Nevskia sp.]|nr:rbsK [Nevskia sp.]
MIVVFGSINLDLIFGLPQLPSRGQTLLGESLRTSPGGKGANQAVAAARDGATVCMAGAVGADALAEDALTGLRAAGVELSRVARVRGSTGCAAIAVDARGDNFIIVAAGANLQARATQIEDAVLHAATTVLLQMEVDPAQNASLVRRAKARGARVILNLAPAAEFDPMALRALDLLVVNEDEGAWLAQHLGCAADAASLHAALGIGVLRTLSVKGAEAAVDGRFLSVPAHQVEAIDSTAAGDCFTGVLAAALDRGADLETAMRRASVAAALCCTRTGSQVSMPIATETEAALGAAAMPVRAVQST